MAIGPIDIELRAHRKSHIELGLAELHDLLLRAGLLRPELIARETDDGEVLVLQLPLQFLQAVILRRESAAAGYIDRKRNLAAKLAQQIWGPVNTLDRDVVETAHRVYLQESEPKIRIGGVPR